MNASNGTQGCSVKELLLPRNEADAERVRAAGYPSWDLTPRQVCDLELLMNGAFSPLEGFLGREDYESVSERMRLTSGQLWPIPITLDVSEEFAQGLVTGQRVALRHPEGTLLATVEVDEIWMPDLAWEAGQVYDTESEAHPAVAYLMRQSNPVYLGGKVRGLQLPTHHDFPALRHTPAELRSHFQGLGWRKVVAFQTRNPLHRAHQELTLRAAKDIGANLLIQPVVGMTKSGDIDHFNRVRCYEHILREYPDETTKLSLLNLAMRMGGPRETLLHAIIRKNYGCTHLIVGRDHAGPGNDEEGRPFYEPYEAQALFKEHENELGISMVPLKTMVYVENRSAYVPAEETTSTDVVLNLSGTEFRRRLREGLDIPEWFSYPSVVQELRRAYPPKFEQGFTVFFTGLSASGKSTVANALMVKLREEGSRPVTLLDGDIVRKNLSSELGFSKEHRDLNIQRIGFVASEITKNGGIAICASIAPYAATRRQVREMVSECGGFVEVYVSTPLEVCEERDRKGLYAMARAGKIAGFTGVDDPYEVPESPEIVIDTTELAPGIAAGKILVTLQEHGYLRAS